MTRPSPQATLKSLCAVVPAAGRGTRLAAEAPKIFVPILPGLTSWDVLHEKLLSVADHIVLVLSPTGQDFVSTRPEMFRADSFERTEIGLQEKPLGMGEAIFGSAELWREYREVFIVWGDQVNLAVETLRACLRLHAAQKVPALTLPVVRAEQPYVEYIFDAADRLTEIRQSREGDVCQPGGFSDLGAFLLRGGPGLIDEWQRYLSLAPAGALTGEINFLPFLVHLSTQAGWPVARYVSDDPNEAMGINTPADLALTRELMQKKMDLP